MIDGGTDWLLHASGRESPEHLFTVENWTKLNTKSLHHLFPPSDQPRDELVEDETLLCILWRPSEQLSFLPYRSLAPLGTPEAIRRCWLVSLSLGWSVFSILVNSILCSYFSNSPTLSTTPHQCTFPLQSLSLITHSKTLLSSPHLCGLLMTWTD